MCCPGCRCEFKGWLNNCPDCKTPLLDEPPPIQEGSSSPISYEALADLVKQHGGVFRIDLSTTDVGM